MASPERMDLDYNTSDGESTDEENPYEQQEKTRRLAWALGQKWDTKVADDRDRLRVDELPGDDDRRNTAELLGAASIGPGRALAHRVNPVDGDQWVLVVDWVRA